MLYEGCCEKNELKSSFIITLIQSTFEMTKMCVGESTSGQ